jgi:hypothetical protein
MYMFFDDLFLVRSIFFKKILSNGKYFIPLQRKLEE